MKRSLFKALGISFALFLAVSSCELIDCKTCEKVTVVNGVETRGPGVLTCGDELADKESEYINIGGQTTYYDCY